MAGGAAAVVIAAILMAKRNRTGVGLRRLALAVAVALLFAVVGLLLHVLLYPGPAPLLLRFITAVTMPGAFALGVLFGRSEPSAAAYFGGFALNVFIWAAFLYAALGRFRAHSV